MAASDNPLDPFRRRFLAAAALSGAAVLPAAAQTPSPDTAPSPQTPPSPPRAGPRNPDAAAESGDPRDPIHQSTSGGDFMSDVLKTLDLEYVAVNPASSLRGLHEALVNRGGNTSPEMLTCVHEEIAVAMAQGYAKIAGKPMAVMVHGTVGMQHAAMGIYNAWCDRVPVLVLAGNILDSEKRGLVADWQHSAVDPGALVRDFVKWDDQPGSLQHFGESVVKAYGLSVTSPSAPVLLSVDTELQENPIPAGHRLRIPKLPAFSQPAADPAALEQTAKMLVGAENPVLIADRMARTQAGMDRLVELAELLQCAVIDQGGRTNFPTLHPLNQGGRGRGVIGQADVIVGFELGDPWLALNSFRDRIVRGSSSNVRPGVKVVHIEARDLAPRSNYQEQGRFQDVDLVINADGETSLPYLIEACRRLMPAGRADALKARGAKLAAAGLASLEQVRDRAAIGWDASPISTARMCAELYHQIKDDDWSLVGQGILANAWPRRLWNGDKVYRYNGGSGGWGLGYAAPGALGGALANKKHGRLSVAIQGDGDLMYAPGTLWTAAHHKIPILYVMHNNRAYHQELMQVQSMANRLDRGIGNASIGNVLTGPNIDFAAMARSMGVHGEGPIDTPDKLAPALKRALAIVRAGEPALVDVVCQPR
jgi:acetolactate synthase I/II/III large subunit